MITRQKLFDLVWSEPVTKVSKVLGLSDRRLGKLCTRYDIPVPPRGYWARRAAGYKPTTPALPVVKREPDERIELRSKPASKAGAAVPMEVEVDAPLETRIEITEPRHSLVRLTGTALRAGTKDQYGRFWGGPGVLDVRVSKASIARALAILDALLRAAEGRGHTVSVKDRKSMLTVDGEAIEFGLDERSAQSERPLSEKERLELARGGYVYGRYSYVPSGELSFHLKQATGAAISGRPQEVET